mmetsp:Transcript_3272/g.6456  ORF Transcript_3272/g.6456 Transcript_3272/m.6456 type:complete len:240 (-) Transcript_3272:149-868(-)
MFSARVQHCMNLGQSWWPSRDAWLAQVQTFSSAAVPWCGGRRHSKTQRRRKQRQVALSKLKGLRDTAQSFTETTMQQEYVPIVPPPGLEEVQRIGDTAVDVEQQELAELRTKIKQMQAEISALEAMGRAAIHHAIEEQERLQGRLYNIKNFTAVETSEEQNDMTNPLDMIYEAVAAATRREMCSNLPAWVPRAEVQKIANLTDTDFEAALADWVQLEGMLTETCIALQDFPPEWSVEEV